MEAQLQKLKVAELKELLAKHHLTQSGKKDELVKRLLDNNVTVDDNGEEELVDIEANGEEGSDPAPAASDGAAPDPVAPSTETATAPADSAPTDTPAELTPEQKAMKARAERFGIPFNPNPTPRTQTKPSKPTSAPTPAAAAPAESTPKAPKEKAGAIDKTSLGLSEEVLAKRAAKFGIPEKKENAPAPAAAVAQPSPAPAAKAEPEVTPEVAEKIALEEEKKRKRAEKFGTVKPVSNGATGEEPDAKKAKV